MASTNKYQIELEVAGPLAMFTRPDTGGTPTSYPVPTWSAAKAILESIAYFSDGSAWICPTMVAVCRLVGAPGGDVSYQSYATNYGGPLRKPALLTKGYTSGGSSMQIFATVLRDVCYRLHAVILASGHKDSNDPRHHLQDLFNRRIKRGQCYRTPCLGWSEFTCAYWGSIREGMTETDTSLNLDIPSMLVGIWDAPTNGSYAPNFYQDVKVVSGALSYLQSNRGHPGMRLEDKDA